MGKMCDFCGKGVLVGNLVSHAHNRTKKRFKPNLKVVRLTVGGSVRKVKLCMSCLKKDRRLKKAEELAGKASQIIEQSKKGQEHFSIV